MGDYTNVYAGQEAIEVLPWVLARVELLPADSVAHAKGPVLRAYLKPNEECGPRLVHAVPSGFITGTFMELDLFDDAELAQFCGTWGMIASPYAGSIARMSARIADPKTEETLLVKEYDASGAELPSRHRIDCERYGRDVWYAGLNGAPRDAAYGARLGGGNWMEAFNRDTTARGGEVLNAYHFAEGGGDRCALIYADEVRHALAIMRVAVLANGFYERAGGNIVHTFRLAVRHDDISEARCGRRPFEEALSLFMDTDFLHPRKEAYASKGVLDGVRESMMHERFRIIEENTMLFADLCLSSIPEPLVAHGGFRRGGLAKLRMPDVGGNARYGNLLQAMAAQLYAYLNDGNPWVVCEVCGRPFKYEQQLMSPITSETKARKEYQCRHRPTKTAFCSKRHEKEVYGPRNAESRRLMKALAKIRADATEESARNIMG